MSKEIGVIKTGNKKFPQITFQLFTGNAVINIFRYSLTMVLLLAKLGVLGPDALTTMQSVSWALVFLPALFLEVLSVVLFVSVFAVVLVFSAAVLIVAAVLLGVMECYGWLKRKVKALLHRDDALYTPDRYTPDELRQRVRQANRPTGPRERGRETE